MWNQFLSNRNQFKIFSKEIETEYKQKPIDLYWISDVMWCDVVWLFHGFTSATDFAITSKWNYEEFIHFLSNHSIYISHLVLRRCRSVASPPNSTWTKSKKSATAVLLLCCYPMNVKIRVSSDLDLTDEIDFARRR